MATFASSSQNTPILIPEILDSHAVASLLQVHLSTVQQLARRGVLPCRKVGKDYRFHKDALLAWLQPSAPSSADNRSRRP